MTWGASPEPTLHACLYEIECGLFCVTYRPGVSVADLHRLPIYQPATCEFVARQRVEQCARALGYQTVVWEGVDTPLEVDLPDRTLFWAALPPVPLGGRSQAPAIRKTSRI